MFNNVEKYHTAKHAIDYNIIWQKRFNFHARYLRQEYTHTLSYLIVTALQL